MTTIRQGVEMFLRRIILASVVVLTFGAPVLADSLPGENTRFCEAEGLNADSFDWKSDLVGIFDGEWDGQASSTLIISKVDGESVEAWYSFGPKSYCEKIQGTLLGSKKMTVTLSWGGKVVYEFGGDHVNGKYSFRGSDSYSPFFRVPYLP